MLWNQWRVAVCLSVVIVLSFCLIHGPGEILVGLLKDLFDCIQFFKADVICEISTKWYIIFHYILSAVGLQRQA